MNDKVILSLMEKLDNSSIVELVFSDETSRLILRKEAAFAKGGPVPPAAGPVTHAAAGTAEANSPVPVHLGLPAAPEAMETVPGEEIIISPIVATFYAAAGPDSPPFVKPGTRVKAGDSLCILEAMKMMNHLEAEFDCEILSVKAANGDLVEYGQALFGVKRL
ncbi:MAG: acetyl-CoA carboxylase biotin carboxyl carrier protein [Treponema sp.]|jgi:acetyl-CoA carboxylase biotin carboxyl carrier protein|nr:acetyl-CoA carboxylase biotin carboxyl carrier protein [Treponema sp.]